MDPDAVRTAIKVAEGAAIRAEEAEACYRLIRDGGSSWEDRLLLLRDQSRRREYESLLAHDAMAKLTEGK